mmetsp:Transcript_5823/g.11701  ORF Transcript_5823/g.11701 Transcript_5823/m.11701 type:complete len:213 (+) Transcript_5823:244-882(+)
MQNATPGRLRPRPTAASLVSSRTRPFLAPCGWAGHGTITGPSSGRPPRAVSLWAPGPCSVLPPLVGLAQSAAISSRGSLTPPRTRVHIVTASMLPATAWERPGAIMCRRARVACRSVQRQRRRWSRPSAVGLLLPKRKRQQQRRWSPRLDRPVRSAPVQWRGPSCPIAVASRTWMVRPSPRCARIATSSIETSPLQMPTSSSARWLRRASGA